MRSFSDTSAGPGRRLGSLGERSGPCAPSPNERPTGGAKRCPKVVRSVLILLIVAVVLSLSKPGRDSFDRYVRARRDHSPWGQLQYNFEEAWARLTGSRGTPNFSTHYFYSVVVEAEGTFVGFLGLWFELSNASAWTRGLAPASLQEFVTKWSAQPVWDIYAIVFLNVAMFLLCGFGTNWRFSASRHSLRAGRYYTLFTAFFCHADAGHLIMNVIWLLSLGSGLQDELGRLRFIELYLFGGLCSCLFSLFLHSAHVEIVGASGAIFALEVANAVVFNDRLFLFAGQEMSAVQILMIRIFLDFLHFIFGHHIDWACHLGGALFGWLYCWLLHNYGRGPLQLVLQSKPHYLVRRSSSKYLLG